MTITTRPLVSLSSMGWITSLEHQVDQLFADFVTSEYSQSVLYYGNILSLPHLVQKSGNDKQKFRRDLKSALEQLFSFYTETTIDVTVEDLSTGSIRYNANVYCDVRYDGQEYNLARQLVIADAKVKKIVNLSNGVYAG